MALRLKLYLVSSLLGLCVAIIINTGPVYAVALQDMRADIDAMVNTEEFQALPFNKRLQLLDEKIASFPEDVDDEVWAYAAYHKLTALARVGNFELGSEYLKSIRARIFDIAKTTDFYVDTLYPAAFIYVYTGDVENALICIEEMKNAPDYKNNSIYQNYTDTILVAIYSNIGNSILASEILIENLENSEENQLPPLTRMKLISNIIYTLVEAEQYEDASRYVNRGLRELDNIRDSGMLTDLEILQVMWHINSNDAMIKIKTGEYGKLTGQVDQLLEYANKLGSPLIQMTSNFVRAAAFFGDGEPQRAAQLLEGVLEEAKSLSATDTLADIYDFYAEVLTSLGRHEEALAAYLAGQEVYNSINIEKIRARTEFMDAQIALGKKNIQIEKLAAANRTTNSLRKRDQVIMILSLCSFGVLFILTLFLLRSRRRLHQYAKDLAISEKEAQQAAQSKSAFLANMSHEIRTPLNGLMGMAQVLAEKDLSKDQQECVDIIVSSGDLLLTVVNDVLDLSKIEAGKMPIDSIPTNVHQVIDQLVRLWHPKAIEKGLELSCAITSDVPIHVSMDPIRVRQCLSNLLSNAIKFTESGEIKVEVSTAKSEARETQLQFSVEDSGVGIDPSFVKKLFTAFEQADKSTTRRFGGTGLGLTITTELARLMGGSLDVCSTPGVGSQFILRVAVSPAEPILDSDVSETGQVAMGRSNAQPKILLVDDNQVNRMVAKAFLSPITTDITEAKNGREALLKLEDNQAYDLVLLDMHMPVMDGPETINEIRNSREVWSGIPIITLTADAMVGDRDRYLAMGTQGYVSKPIVKEDLQNEVNRILSNNIKWRMVA